ncbi:hypothetical protein [Promicromonospora umidemergens]|uniref:HTH araC/xylS-type domain-containing protein n=1 Tax=Promicromonospora umidemergens TaxID=629679 RepID=A0ABP8WDF0_9MICO|nr:hypothetical protein [Promicromonospora umidemergens]
MLAIATRVGLVSATNLRRRFRAHLGTTPGTYRRTFSDPRLAHQDDEPAPETSREAMPDPRRPGVFRDDGRRRLG